MYIKQKSSKRVFPNLVSYFDKAKGGSVVEHFQSIECIVSNAETLFNEIVRLFSRDNITWDNLVSLIRQQYLYTS